MAALRRWILGAAIGTALLALGSPTAAGIAPPAALKVLLARLRAHGRAEADLVLTRDDPLSGRPRATRGRLALELPHFARLEFPATGECLTLRGDGGDWLQPATRQLLHAGPEAAGGPLRWWVALLDSGAALREETVPGHGTRVSLAGDAEAAQRIELGKDGLPVRLEVEVTPGEVQHYPLARWHLTARRGRAGFVLNAPPGFETVEMR